MTRATLPMCVDVLGPIRAFDADGREVTPPGVLQRRLLALLVLRRGRVVSVDTVTDTLWPSDPPANPAAAVQNHVFRLRRGLPDGVVESVADGYRIDSACLELDADRLLAAIGDVSSDRTTLAELEAILGRWTGPAFPELDDTDEGRAEAARLEEVRVRARERHAELALAKGDAPDVVTELAALVAEHPYRERPSELLMRALSAQGRHVEALRVYDDFRRVLADQLGVDPSPSLTALHEELLGIGERATSTTARVPVPATSLVGRDAVAAEVTSLAESHRLVSLVGPGGIGKTRLLIEIGHGLRSREPDRPVAWCELAAAGPESALDVIAAALGIDARPGVPLIDRIAGVVGDSSVVVLLDNCEHVLDPVAELVVRMLGSCPNARLVATSRERLRVPAEQVYVVPPLAAEGEAAPAVALFVERARAVAPHFDPDVRDLACIAEIARRLDGLPLAIELAAARLHTHDVREISAGLNDRFSLLSAGYRSSDRHGSLHAVVSWSYELLDPTLQRILSDLSVFATAFTANDAVAVCGVDERQMAAALAQLVERSLVMRAPGRRFVLLETLRAFGAEQLIATDRADVVAERHARYQVDWLERADRELLQPADGSTLADIDAALPELRTALTWLLDHDHLALAGRLVASLIDYGFLRLRPDVFVWSERVLAADPDDESPMASLVWVAAAFAAWMAGDRIESSVRSERALRLATADGGDPPSEIASIVASAALFEGRLTEAADWYHRAVIAAGDDRAQQMMTTGPELLALGYRGDPTVVDRAAQVLDEIGDLVTPHTAYLWYCAGEAVMAVDVESALLRLTRALELAEVTHASFVRGVAGASKASIDARRGDPRAAAREYRTLLDFWRRAGMWSTQWTVLRSIAVLLARLGRPRDAAVLEGAVRSTDAGHVIFGDDEVALNELRMRLRVELGDDVYEAARAEGALLDGDAAVEHALRSLA
ncbi:MAG: BTAD domain-containing putative transcriptional regulator [Ilumatobacteraceae bacterium]